MVTGATMAASAASSAFTTSDLKGRYAIALYELAEENRILNETMAEAKNFLELVQEDDRLQKLLINPSLDTLKSCEFFVNSLREAGFSQLFQNFVGVVARNRRLSSLKVIFQSFISLVNMRRGIVTAEISTVYPLTDIQKARLKDRLAEAGYNKVNLQERIDKKLLGGFVIRIGAKFYDASLKSRLNRLHNVMKGAA
ncbi:ATP synthase subunit delta [Commensalibacter sp. Nvir]|uniref:ATP synthase F1 subunit delta n=1 Tax=Commensalibacter sp. Nvir TaxID=3069817 RepID=UPI002D4C3E5F|nr:ATP synthase subunit delta [Commensalibacter sp. Nvir]